MGHLIVAFLVLTILFLLVATLLAILCPRRPWLGVSQHWGLQLWQIALLIAAISIALMAWWIAGIAALIALYWTGRLFASGERRVVEEADDALRVLSANLLHSNDDHVRIVRMIEESAADLVILCEATMQARTALLPLAVQYPHALDTCAPDSLYGIVILSRFPLKLRGRGVGEDPAPRHLAVDVDAHDDAGDRAFTLAAIHPTNPLRLDRAHRIPREFDAVAQLCRAAPDDLILIGDCNAAGWSRALRDLERDTGLTNDRRIRPSWPVWLPMPLRLPLDHVWARGRLRLARATLGPSFGSDHLPLMAELIWREK